MREPIVKPTSAAPSSSEGASGPHVSFGDVALKGEGFAPDDADHLLRPQHMKDMVGQREVAERLEIAVDAARKRGETLGHILFDGPPGLGKTTFATCIPRDLGVTLQIASGAALMAPKDLIPYLTNAEEGSVLFIDEIHRLPKAVEEFLYPAMEDFRIDIMLGEGVNARTINMPLRPFTLIGATTRAGLLSAPLRDRFHMREHLDFYSVEELTEIVRRSAVKLRVKIDDASAEEIARRSRGTPRLANNRLRWVRDYATSNADGQITLDVAQAGAGDARHRPARARRAGPQISGDDRPRLSRRTGGRRSGGPHDESCARHAFGRSRAVSAAQRTGHPHAARPQTDARRLFAPGNQSPADFDLFCESIPVRKGGCFNKSLLGNS